jgi:hypothetical protein
MKERASRPSRRAETPPLDRQTIGVWEVFYSGEVFLQEREFHQERWKEHKGSSRGGGLVAACVSLAGDERGSSFFVRAWSKGIQDAIDHPARG